MGHSKQNIHICFLCMKTQGCYLISGGEFIIPKLAEPECGVIGFVGDKARFSCCSGWYQFCDMSKVSYFYQRIKEGKTLFLVENADLNQPFQEVITLDGLGFWVRKDIWEKYPFDEELLTGFHCYDIDFSLQIATANYKIMCVAPIRC